MTGLRVLALLALLWACAGQHDGEEQRTGRFLRFETTPPERSHGSGVHLDAEPATLHQSQLPATDPTWSFPYLVQSRRPTEFCTKSPVSCLLALHCATRQSHSRLTLPDLTRPTFPPLFPRPPLLEQASDSMPDFVPDKTTFPVPCELLTLLRSDRLLASFLLPASKPRPHLDPSPPLSSPILTDALPNTLPHQKTFPLPNKAAHSLSEQETDALPDAPALSLPHCQALSLPHCQAVSLPHC